MCKSKFIYFVNLYEISLIFFVSFCRWISVQPLLGVEGDPMRLLFEKDLTPHPQYCAAYKYTGLSEEKVRLRQK